MAKRNRKYVKILNVKIDSTSIKKVLEFVNFRLDQKQKFLILTPNPEIVLEAQKDKNLLYVLNKANVCLPDGVGLIYAARLLHLKGRPGRAVRGREVFIDLCRMASRRGWKVFLLGGRKGVARKAAANLKKQFRNLAIEYFYGPKLNENAVPVAGKDKRLQKATIYSINKYRPDLLFVGFGCPKQEKWSYQWLSRLNVGGIMVVGGAFDYVSGTTELPPKWMENAGLEWLWRLYRQPRRVGRIFRAVIVFPLAILRSKILN